MGQKVTIFHILFLCSGQLIGMGCNAFCSQVMLPRKESKRTKEWHQAFFELLGILRPISQIKNRMPLLCLNIWLLRLTVYPHHIKCIEIVLITWMLMPWLLWRLNPSTFYLAVLCHLFINILSATSISLSFMLFELFSIMWSNDFFKFYEK